MDPHGVDPHYRTKAPFATGQAPRPNAVHHKTRAPYNRPLCSDRGRQVDGVSGAIISEEGLVRPAASPGARAHTTTELALNPELNKKVYGKKQNYRDRNFMAKNKSIVAAQSRTVKRERRAEGKSGAGDNDPYLVAEGTRKFYGHVESKFMKDRAEKAVASNSTRARRERIQAKSGDTAWLPNQTKGRIKRDGTAKPKAPKRVEVEVSRLAETQPWTVTKDDNIRLDNMQSATYRERVKRQQELDALVDHDPEDVRTEGLLDSGAKGRKLALPRYIVNRKTELEATRADQQKVAVSVDPDPPEGFRWLTEGNRKAQIRKWTLRKRELQVELNRYARVRDDKSALWKRTKEAELKMARAKERLRLLGAGRSRADVLTDTKLLADPNCLVKVESAFVTGGKVAPGAVQRSRVYVLSEAAKIKVEVNLKTCTVKQLKEKIEEKTGAPPRWQRLGVRGITMADAKLLTHYGVMKDGVIKLHMRALADPLPPQHQRTQPPSIVKPPWALDK